MPDPKIPLHFQLFNEIGILAQLSGALLQARLPQGFLLSHFSVLNHLSRVGDGQTPLKISQSLQVAKTTMTHTLSGLEKAGLVEMRVNEDDGRSKRVWLTPAGRAFRDKAIMDTLPRIGELKADYSEDRVRAILPELEALRKILDGNRD